MNTTLNPVEVIAAAFAQYRTVTVRYCQKAAAITSTGFRLVFMGELYNIENIDHMNFRKRSLKFACRKERR